jgi:hypothetical protein
MEMPSRPNISQYWHFKLYRDILLFRLNCFLQRKNWSIFFRVVCRVVKMNRAVPQLTYGSERAERRYSSYSFTTSALAEGEWSAWRPGRSLLPGKGPPLSIGQEAGWAPEPVCTERLEEKSSYLCRESNLYFPVFQSIVRHYTKLPGSYVVVTHQGNPILLCKVIVNFFKTRMKVAP